MHLHTYSADHHTTQASMGLHACVTDSCMLCVCVCMFINMTPDLPQAAYAEQCTSASNASVLNDPAHVISKQPYKLRLVCMGSSTHGLTH